MAIWTIARHSFKEAIRKRILMVAGLFAVALVGSAPFWPALTNADRANLVKDISLTAMTFLGVIVAVFVSAYSLPSDIESRQIFTLASKPVRRHEILLGKLCGFLMVLAVILALMGVVSDIVIRSVSTFSRLEVTAAEAPIIVKGAVIGAVGKGRKLRVAGTEGKHYIVVLPADLSVREAKVAAADVDAGKTSGQLRIKAAEASLTYNDVEIARAPEGTLLAIKEVLEGCYLVHLPESLRIREGLVPASHVSPPRRSLIRSKRIVEPARRVLHNRGRVSHEKDILLLTTSFIKALEVWHFTGIEAGKLPEADSVRVLLRAPGVYGAPVERNAAGSFNQDEIREFDATLEIRNPRSAGPPILVEARVAWDGSFFATTFDLPRKTFAGGAIDMTVTRTTPRFADRSTAFFAGRRHAVWHFEGLKTSRFPAAGRVRGEMKLELHHGNMPAHGGRVAQVKFKVASPSSGRSEVVTVPIRNQRAVEFAFSRELMDSGNVDISILKVPKGYAVGLPNGKVAVKLFETSVSLEWSYFKAVALVFCLLMIVSSITLAASTFVSGGIAALVGFFTYFCGLVVSPMSEPLAMGPAALGGHQHGAAEGAQAARAAWPVVEELLKTFVAITPDARDFDGKMFLLKGLDVPDWNVVAGAGTALVYMIVFMAFAYGIFRRKELG